MSEIIKQLAAGALQRGRSYAATQSLGKDFAQEQKDEAGLQRWLPWAKELASYGLSAALAPFTGGTSLLLSGLIKSGTSLLTDKLGDVLARDVFDLGGQIKDIKKVGPYGKDAYDKIIKNVEGFRGDLTGSIMNSLIKGYSSAALSSGAMDKFKSDISAKYFKSDIVPDWLKTRMIKNESISQGLIDKGLIPSWLPEAHELPDPVPSARQSFPKTLSNPKDWDINEIVKKISQGRTIL